MARFGRMFALGSGDGKTVPTKTSPSSLQKLWRTLSAEKERVPLRFFTYPVKSTRVLFKEIELWRTMRKRLWNISLRPLRWTTPRRSWLRWEICGCAWIFLTWTSFTPRFGYGKSFVMILPHGFTMKYWDLHGFTMKYCDCVRGEGWNSLQ